MLPRRSSRARRARIPTRARRRAGLHAVAAACALACWLAPEQALAQRESRIAGIVREQGAGTPLAGVLLELAPGARVTHTDAEGRFHFEALPAGAYTVRARRLGYAPVAHQLRIAARDSALVELELVPTTLSLGTVVVTGRSGERALTDVFQPTTVLEGEALDRRLGASIAASIAGEPGVTQRYNGPMAAQPVIRGLSGDRVLVLEDGLRTGDIASTAPDHAVTVEPMAARRIEVVRGPAGLLHGSNTLGGVINVVRDEVPRTLPERASYTLGVMGESANRGTSGGGTITTRVGRNLATRADFAARTSGDTRTPGGMLPFTDVEGFEGSVGASWIANGSFIGGAVREYRSLYGVPSSFAGVTLPGSHDGGVYIDVRRTASRVEGEWSRDSGALRSLSGRANYVRFEQSELERGGFVGTRLGQLAATGDVLARLESGRHAGAVGVWAQSRDFRAEGSYTGTRPARQFAAAAFAFDEVRFDPLRVLAGVRVDRSVTQPLDSTETSLLRDVRTRAFDAVTGSLAATYALAPGVVLGASVARAFRAPAIEELYSAGPHLAGYVYEVGNPDLRPEVGHGADVFLRVERARIVAEVGAFRNDVRDFIRYAPVVDSATGLPMRDPRLRRYVVYRPIQADARLVGAEGKVEWVVLPTLALDATVSMVRGTRSADGEPLAEMPPLHARLALRRETPRMIFGVSLDAAASQRRVPAPPTDAGAGCGVRATDGEAEVIPADYCPTPGYALVGAHVGRRWSVGGRVYAATLVVDNIFDTIWRDHLWRAKLVAPQPGRNVKLLLRVMQ